MKTLLHYLFLLFFSTTTITISLNIIPAVHSLHCSKYQQQSLLHFKKSLHFKSSYSSKLVYWNSTTDCCSWVGITCSAEGNVVGLDISDEYTEGGNVDNSSSLFNLRHLESLNLGGNEFDEFSLIPSAIGKLTNLRYLNLSYNFGLTGQIPIEISSLTRLVVLDISHTWVGDMPDFSLFFRNLTEITELYLDDVGLSTQKTHWCQALSSSMPNLKVLSLTRTVPQTGPPTPVDQSFAKLHSLSVIRLDGMNFSGPIPGFFTNFTKLTSLSLADCELQGTFPNEIFQVPTLQTIDLSSNPDLHGSLPEFPKNGSLRSLVLSGTNLSGFLPESISNLKNLTILILSGSPVDMIIDLSLGSHFTGPIPKSIENLIQLVYVDLSWNRFSGPIDSIHWENLIHLGVLKLDNNLLEGSIPPSLFSLPLLPKLVLSNNHFSGLHEFSNIYSSCLLNLDLSFNNLEGPIPVSIFNLQGLESLDLSYNNVSAFPFNGPKQLRNLTYIDLSHNSLQNFYNGTDSSYSSFPGIRELICASNNLSTFPDFLRNQSTLYQLDLSANQIQGKIPNWIWKLDSLHDLNLSCNSLVTLEAPFLNSTTRVQRLDLHSNQLQGPIPFFLRNPYYLDYSSNHFNSSIPNDIGDFLTSNTSFLSLSTNSLHGIIPESICNGLYLWVLNLSYNFLSGTIPECLTRLKILGVLNLRRNNLTGTISDRFPGSNNCHLQVLDLSSNQIEGQFPKSLISCTELELLNLGRNQITDMFPCLLKNISTLRVLILRSNKFYGDIGCPSTYDDYWPKLQIIDLAHNHLSGGIPGRALTTWEAMMAPQSDVNILTYIEESAGPGIEYRDGVSFQGAITITGKGSEMDLVKIQTFFTLIDFSFNKFNGSIPKEIGELKSLYFLNLSNNAFTGEISSAFGKMKQLESLDLSQNKLSGKIPQQLANLSFLAVLDLSNNELVGRIPTSTQFSTFPKDSFIGNIGLWGPPLTADNKAARSSPPPALNGNVQNSGDDDEINWDVIIVEIGFIFGFAIAIGSLVFCKRWSQWYYKAMYNILVKIFPQLDERIGPHRRHVQINQRWR